MAIWRKRVRKRTLEAQNGICPYCDRPALIPSNHHRNHHRQDGFDVVVCCSECHNKLNKVEGIFLGANNRLRQEIVYSILMVAPPDLTRELTGAKQNSALREREATAPFSAEILFKAMGNR